jgi:hypothetical protein
MVHLSEEQARHLGVDLAASFGLAHTFSIEDAIAAAATHAEPAHEGAWSSPSEGECPAPGAKVRELLRRLESARLLVVEASGRYRFLARRASSFPSAREPARAARHERRPLRSAATPARRRSISRRAEERER